MARKKMYTLIRVTKYMDFSKEKLLRLLMKSFITSQF